MSPEAQHLKTQILPMRPEPSVPPNVPDQAILTLVGLMFALSVMTYFVRTILSIAGPSIIKEFHLSETEMGAIYSAFLFSYSLLMLPAGYLTDLWGPNPPSGLTTASGEQYIPPSPVPTRAS